MIYDAQVNYGNSPFGPDSDIDIYLKNIPKETKKVLLIPTGTHILKFDNDHMEISCVWDNSDGITYDKTLIQNNNEIKLTNPINPYINMNDHVLKKVNELNGNDLGIKFYFAPKIHPRLDDENALDNIIDSPFVKAIKLQGLATYATPEDISPWTIKKAKEKDIPFFLHTDYVNPDYNLKDIDENIFSIMKKNNPRSCFNWAQKNNVRSILAHGVRLDKDLIKEINKRDDTMISVGPVSLINEEKGRLYTKTNDYLEDLLKFTDPKNLIFSTDYRWNAKNRGNWDDLEWDSHKKVIKIGKKIGLSDDELNLILYENANNFLKC